MLKENRRKAVHWLLISLSIFFVAILVILGLLNSPYLSWDYSKIEYAIVGTIWHSFEWLFVRIAPFILIGLGVGIFLTRKKD